MKVKILLAIMVSILILVTIMTTVNFINELNMPEWIKKDVNVLIVTTLITLWGISLVLILADPCHCY